MCGFAISVVEHVACVSVVSDLIEQVVKVRLFLGSECSSIATPLVFDRIDLISVGGIGFPHISLVFGLQDKQEGAASKIPKTTNNSLPLYRGGEFEQILGRSLITYFERLLLLVFQPRPGPCPRNKGRPADFQRQKEQKPVHTAQ